MNSKPLQPFPAGAAFFLAFATALTAATDDVRSQAERWRAEHRLIDLHQHVNYTEPHLSRAVRIMDAAGIGIEVNLSGGTVTRTNDAPSAFERNKRLADERFPGRFLHYMNLDYSRWNEPDFTERAVWQVEEGYRLGAAGLKEFKRLGLYLRDKDGKLLKIDDPKLDAVWKRCGELGMPISIHVADPKAFWLPYNDKNERWKELKDHRNWWFGEPSVYPPHEELLAALNRVIERHPNTTFVCVHFANNPEDLDWVEKSLDRYPNMNADLAARIPEIGRHDPERVRRLFVKHQDRIFFATDFQVYDQLTLGSGGSGPPPTDGNAKIFFEKHWRWLETNDRNWEHMTPIQGDWTINAIGLPASVLRKIYFDNARRLLARSLPSPVAKAARVAKDFALRGDLSHRAWMKARPVYLESVTQDGGARPELSTPVRVLWSEQYLYLGYECPFTEIKVFEPAELKKERLGLWDRDVVEAFIGTDAGKIDHYTEFELAPNGEKLDLLLDPPRKDFDWSSRFECKVHRNNKARIWTAEMRIPLRALSDSKPASGTRWRINFYRCDRANNAFLAWNPTLSKSFHVPARFGILEFED
ncbi:MAG: amidohydrolase family protein [Verrucomicrobia bacterium]|nr:amidohydrolase family protein [Verrucomicrobiota bacterium]